MEWKTNLSEDDGAARSIGGGDMLTYVIELRMALAYLVDLAAVPGRRMVAALAEACPCPPEAAKLKEMATEEGYKAQVGLARRVGMRRVARLANAYTRRRPCCCCPLQVLGKKLTLVELLLQFRSVPVDLSQFVNLLPRMSRR